MSAAIDARRPTADTSWRDNAGDGLARFGTGGDSAWPGAVAPLADYYLVLATTTCWSGSGC